MDSRVISFALSLFYGMFTWRCIYTEKHHVPLFRMYVQIDLLVPQEDMSGPLVFVGKLRVRPRRPPEWTIDKSATRAMRRLSSTVSATKMSS